MKVPIMTVLTADAPTGKRYSRNADGEVKKTATVRAKGIAVGVEVNTAAEMAELLRRVTSSPNEVPIPGAFVGSKPGEPFDVVYKKELKDWLGPDGDGDISGLWKGDEGERDRAARVKGSVELSVWQCLDCDTPPGMPDKFKLDIAGRLALLEKISPGISRCERVECRSSSARVVEPGGAPKGASHAWVRISNPELLDEWRSHMRIEAPLHGVSFPVSRRSKATGEAIGRPVHLTLIDLAVLRAGRIVFCSAPQIGRTTMAGWKVVDAGVEIVNPGAGPLGISWAKKPTEGRLAARQDVTGECLDVTQDGTGLVANAYGMITLDMPIEAQNAPVSTIGEAWEWLKGQPKGTHMRCQSPFRESTSWAAYVNLGHDGKKPFLHDSGTDTNYWLEDEIPPGFAAKLEKALAGRLGAGADPDAAGAAGGSGEAPAPDGEVLEPDPQPRRRIISEEAASVLENFLADLVHVGSEDEFWSHEAGGLLKGSAVDDRWTSRLLVAGHLATRTAGNMPSKTLLTPRTVWRRSEQSQKVAKIVHRLGAPRIIDDCLNIAPALPARLEVEGTPEPWLELVSFICSGLAEDVEAVLDWFAMVVTAWDEKPGWHLLLRARQGVGKNLTLQPVVKYLKPDHAQNVKAVHLDSRFNTYLTKRLVLIDELKMNTRGSATGHDIYEIIKAHTARGMDMVSVERKRMEPFEVLDLSCWVPTSNEDAPLPLENDDRRFMVPQAPEKKGPRVWYRGIVRWLEKENGNAIVVSWLHRRWDAMTEERRQALREEAPMTEAKQDMIDAAADHIDGAVRLAIEGKHDVQWPELMRLKDVVARLKDRDFDLLSETQRRQVNLQRVKMAMRRAGAVKLFKGEQIRGPGREKVRLWCLNPAKATLYEQMSAGQKLYEKYEELKKQNIPAELQGLLGRDK